MTASVTVTVSTPPVSAGSDFAVCSGSPATLSGSGAVSYSWDNSVTDNTPFTPVSTMNYIVTGTDSIGCTNTDTVAVTVNSLPNVSAGVDLGVCSGSATTLSGSGASTYSWDNSVLDGVPFTPAATMSYIVTGTDGNGCSNTDTVNVIVNSLPVVDAGADQGACNGAQVTLSGSGAVSYTWDNNVTDGVPFTVAFTQDYIVTGTDANGCTDMDTVTVEAYHTPSVSGGPDLAVCAGSPVTLSGSGADMYSWDNSVVDSVPFVPAVTTVYTVTGTDTNGCAATAAVTVTVNTVNVTTSVLNETITAAATPATYQWINCSNNAPVSGATSQSFTATANGNYAVIVTQNGCADTSACQTISSVGIHEAAQNGFSLYPNPTNGALTLTTGDAIALEVSIIDVYGKTVAAVKPSAQLVNLDLSGYANGIYFIRISMASGAQMIRVVKQ
jgi:hypothetical protein